MRAYLTKSTYEASTSDAWEDVAEGCKNSWVELKTSLQKATDEFKS
jgi:hypothetical protein